MPGHFLIFAGGLFTECAAAAGSQLEIPIPATSGPHAGKAGLRAVSPGVVIAHSLPELLQIMNEEKSQRNAVVGFRTQSMPSPGELVPSHVSLAPLPNGHMAITLKTRSYVTYLAIGGVEYYIQVQHPGYPVGVQIDGESYVNYGGVMPEERTLLFHWVLNSPSESTLQILQYNPYDPGFNPNPTPTPSPSPMPGVETDIMPHGAYQVLAQGIYAYALEEHYSSFTAFSACFNAAEYSLEEQAYMYPATVTTDICFLFASLPVNVPFHYPMDRGLITPLGLPAGHEEPLRIERPVVFEGEEILRTESVFSPRDQNSVYDKLQIQITAALDRVWLLYLSTPMPDFETAVLLGSGTGPDSIEWDGFLEDGACLHDGRFGVFLLSTDQQILQRELFSVDNTPPVVSELVHNEVQTAEDTWLTTLSFAVEEPEVNEVRSELEPAAVKIFVDAAAFENIPQIDEAGFWLLTQGAAVPFELQTNDEYTAQVSLTLPYRLQGQTVWVEVADKMGNQARYTLYPQGGEL